MRAHAHGCTRTHAGICTQCARAHEPSALFDKVAERSRKICSCAWRSRRSLRRHFAAAAATAAAVVTVGTATIGTGKTAADTGDTDSFFTQALASSLHAARTSTAAAAPAASASRAVTVAIASSIAASSTSVCEVAQVIDSAAFISFSLRSMLAAGDSQLGAPTANSMAARPARRVRNTPRSRFGSAVRTSALRPVEWRDSNDHSAEEYFRKQCSYVVRLRHPAGSNS